ncbi:hypothetical protein GQ457_04G018400 [Hibiscus cannabinus]
MIDANIHLKDVRLFSLFPHSAFSLVTQDLVSSCRQQYFLGSLVDAFIVHQSISTYMSILFKIESNILASIHGSTESFLKELNSIMNLWKNES